jgi:hypothetical protein
VGAQSVVAAQVALAVTLAIGGALFIGSLARGGRIPVRIATRPRFA